MHARASRFLLALMAPVALLAAFASRAGAQEAPVALAESPKPDRASGASGTSRASSTAPLGLADRRRHGAGRRRARRCRLAGPGPHHPVRNAARRQPARQAETRFWIAYDQNHLYVAFRAHDPEPLAIRARLRDRDSAFQDDFVGIVLDTFNDERRAFEFFVNPLGVQMDLLQQRRSPATRTTPGTRIWDSAGRITETGYEVEIAIPFSSLRFPRADDR